MNDDKLMKAAGQLSTEINPERDLWADISDAIDKPLPRRWTPMLAQVAAIVLLVGASSVVTYVTMKDGDQRPVIASPEMIFEQASFANRYSLGPGFQDARNALAAEFDAALEKLPAESQQDIETNLKLIRDAIFDMNMALEEDPENLFLQERLLRTYREELMLLRRVGGLTRNVMLRNDI